MSVRSGAVVALALAACAPAPADDPTLVAVDSSLVDLLADVHLADARAALAADSARRPALADSLRAVALRAHGLDPAAYEARLARLAGAPAAAAATYDALARRLAADRLAR